ncbi:MAG: type II toxin-antitoxin system PemK/MazF family toxin [bacterium]|nr:type II toxin-antitoxin system PemK/MazF family toxin [bacterium]
MAKLTKAVQPKRGDIWLAAFDPTIGREIRKTRPAVILQNDIGNRISGITIVAALSSKFTEPIRPIEALVRVPEGGLSTDSVVLLNQVRSIDKKRLIKRLGKLSDSTITAIDHALLISFGLIDF